MSQRTYDHQQHPQPCYKEHKNDSERLGVEMTVYVSNVKGFLMKFELVDEGKNLSNSYTKVLCYFAYFLQCLYRMPDLTRLMCLCSNFMCLQKEQLQL